jgi:hypothetical protein
MMLVLNASKLLPDTNSCWTSHENLETQELQQNTLCTAIEGLNRYANSTACLENVSVWECCANIDITLQAFPT